MTRILDRLAIGGQDCHEPREGWVIVCACAACFHAVGVEGLAVESPGRLILNLPDPPVPLFRRELFETFLQWACAQWEAGASILIHDDAGVSRAPSLALLFCAKALGVIPSGGYDEAWDGLESFIAKA